MQERKRRIAHGDEAAAAKGRSISPYVIARPKPCATVATHRRSRRREASPGRLSGDCTPKNKKRRPRKILSPLPRWYDDVSMRYCRSAATILVTRNTCRGSIGNPHILPQGGRWSQCPRWTPQLGVALQATCGASCHQHRLAPLAGMCGSACPGCGCCLVLVLELGRRC